MTYIVLNGMIIVVQMYISKREHLRASLSPTVSGRNF